MSATFKVSDILNPQSEEDCYNELIDVLSDLNPEVSPNINDYAVGSVMDSWLRTAAHIYHMGLEHSQYLMQSQFVKGAQSDALTRICEGTYDNKRVDAVPTQGYFRFILDDKRLGPYTITPKDTLIVKYIPQDTIQFTPLESFTLSVYERTKDVKVQCTTSGTIGNISYGSSLQCLEIPGVLITNPIYSGSNWITQVGRDQESDNILRNRSTTKFATYNIGETISDKLINLVLNATSSNGTPIVSYCSIDDLNPRGAGTVNVYIANDLDLVTQTQINLIQSGVLDTNFFGNQSTVGEPRIKCYASDTLELDSTQILGTIGYSGNFETVRNNVESALDEFVKTIPIGGFTYDGLIDKGILFSEFEHLILNIPGITSVVLDDNDEEMIKIEINEKPIAPIGQVGQRWTKSISNIGSQSFTWKLIKRR